MAETDCVLTVRKEEDETLIIPPAAVVACSFHTERGGAPEHPVGLVCVAEECHQVLRLSQRPLKCVVAAICLEDDSAPAASHSQQWVREHLLRSWQTACCEYMIIHCNP